MQKVKNDDLNEAIRMRLPLKSIKHQVLNRGCDVNAISKDGYSALIEAIDAQLDEAAMFLIEQGADIHFADERGANALYFSVINGSWDLFSKLLEMGLDSNLTVSGYPLLNVACSIAYKFIRLDLKVTRIVEGKKVRVTDQSEIDRVAGKDRYQNFVRIANKLLELGADVNGVESGNQQTSLTLCAGRGGVEIANLLIKAGASTEIKDAAGLVALHWAARRGHLDIVEALLANGADPNAVEAYGFTPLHEAAENNRPRIAEALIAAGADKGIGLKKSFAPFNVGDTPKDIAIKKRALDVAEVL